MTPKNNRHVDPHLRLPADLYRELKRQAERRDVSFNRLVTIALRHWLGCETVRRPFLELEALQEVRRR
jgi:hypothetical protein